MTKDTFTIKEAIQAIENALNAGYLTQLRINGELYEIEPQKTRVLIKTDIIKYNN